MPSMMRRLPVSLALGGLLLAGASVAALAETPAPAAAAASSPAPATATTPLGTIHALPGAPTPPALPDVASYVLMDARTGAIIASRGGSDPRAPASLTKLMTAYLTYQAIAQGRLKPDQVVPVSTDAWKAGGSRMFISPSMKVTVDQLLHGLIIDSGNDAATALAEAVGGSQDGFVTQMNEAAQKLGLTGTHYTDVSGLPQPGLHTTALDVAKLSRALILEYPQILKISSQKYYTFDNIRQRSWNPVLFRDAAVDGLKTGLTDAAGHCIDATALRNGDRLIAVTMGSPSWESGTQSIEALLDYGYNYFHDATIATPGKALGTMKDARFDPEEIPVGAGRSLVKTVPQSPKTPIKATLHLNPAPLRDLPKGTPVGTITYSLGSDVLATLPAVTLEATKPAGFMTRMMRKLHTL